MSNWEEEYNRRLSKLFEKHAVRSPKGKVRINSEYVERWGGCETCDYGANGGYHEVTLIDDAGFIVIQLSEYEDPFGWLIRTLNEIGE